MKMYLLVAASATFALATPALAQGAEWTGPYVGVNIGYTDAKSDTTTALSGAWTSESAALQSEVTTRFAATQSIEDINFGDQIGYNYQMGGALLGLEVDIAALSGGDVTSRGPLASTTVPSLAYTYTNRVNPEYLLALKARAGVPMGNTLLFVEGGWAFTEADLGADILSNGGYSKSGRFSDTMEGFIVGGGIEHRFSPNLSARLSYDYTDQGEESYVNAYNAGSTFTSPVYTETMTQDLQLHLIRVGLNFHF